MHANRFRQIEINCRTRRMKNDDNVFRRYFLAFIVLTIAFFFDSFSDIVGFSLFKYWLISNANCCYYATSSFNRFISFSYFNLRDFFIIIISFRWQNLSMSSYLCQQSVNFSSIETNKQRPTAVFSVAMDFSK